MMLVSNDCHIPGAPDPSRYGRPAAGWRSPGPSPPPGSGHREHTS